jgi:hypothetical protein
MVSGKEIRMGVGIPMRLAGMGRDICLRGFGLGGEHCH